MAEELEELWKKLMVTDEKDEAIVLGSNSTRVVKDRKSTRLNSSHYSRSRMPSSA